MISMPICRHRGFTLLELLVVVAVIAVLMALAGPRYWNGIDRGKEAVLRENLLVIREQLDHFYVDRGRYPDRLEDLVEHRYLRDVPTDPLTQSNDSWVLVPPPSGKMGRIANVHSGAPGQDDKGQPYRSW